MPTATLRGARLPAVTGRPGVQVGAIVLLALAIRVALVLRNDAAHGTFGYDSGVYFAGADAFVHGRMPYRDFVLLHPPVLMVVLAPFAALASVVGDSVAFTITLFAFAALGATNAGLVVVVGRRLGLPDRAAVVGGAVYAVWFGTIGAEYLIKLETLANTMLLVSVLALLSAREARAGISVALAGLPLGVFATVKIWCAVPALLLLLWFAASTRGLRRSAFLAAGAITGCVLVNLLFLVAAPGAMWSSVVTDQLGRRSSSDGLAQRLADLSTVPRLFPSLSPIAQAIVAVGFVTLLGAIAQRAWRVRPFGPPAVVLLVAQTAVLLASPSWFVPYCAYAAVPFALTVGIAAAAPRPRPANVLTASTALLTLLVVTLPLTRGASVRGADVLSRAVAPYRCVMSDTPIMLIRLNVLTRDLRAGCPNWVDVTGRTYGPDRGPTPRVRNERWQRDLQGYLTSGGAIVIGRQTGTGIAPDTWRVITRGGAVARVGGRVVYRVAPASND